jgi:hypothetical protein
MRKFTFALPAPIASNLAITAAVAFYIQPVHKIRIDVFTFLGWVGFGFYVLDIHDRHYRQVKMLGKQVIALIAAWYGHYRTGTVTGQARNLQSTIVSSRRSAGSKHSCP